MTGTGTITKTWLSGAIGLTLVLGLFAFCQAATDVYYLRPQANTHNNSYNSVSQTFVGTCDSVTKIAFFIGQNSGNSNYLMEIDSAGIAKGGVLTLSATLAKPYAENEGTYGSPVPVKRGYTYTLKFSRQTPSHKVDFYYLADTMAYPWGKITDPIVTGDLCGRAVGVNRTDSTYWGVNAYLAYSNGYQDSLVSKAKQLGMVLDREQIKWQDFQDSTHAYHWAPLDSAVKKAHRKGLRVMIDIFGTPPWASSQSFSINPDVRETSAWHYPPRNLGRPFVQSDSNFLWKFANDLANRYKADSFGVHDYEIWNETNYYDGWRYGLGKGDTCFYDPGVYPQTQYGRAKLYVRACEVAWNAIKTADPQAIIQTNAVLHMLATTQGYDERGREWMMDYYSCGGKDFADIIAWHWYLNPYANDTTKHRFQPRQFIAEYDTLRRIMRDAGDGAKPVWANEGGYGSPNPANWDSLWSVDSLKQADIALQACVTGLGQRENGIGPALNQVNWYKLYDDYPHPDTLYWWQWCGVLKKPADGLTYKPSAWAYKQMTGKLKDKYFNRRVPLADTNVYCYEFQTTDTGLAARKTWVIWKANSSTDSLYMPIRTPTADSIKIQYGQTESLQTKFALANGKVVLLPDTVPMYLKETGTISRPDVVVDDLYTSPPNPKAGDGLKFFARLKNIGNAALSGTVPDTVTFQVDGTTIVRYGASRGLGIPGSGTDTLTVGYFFPGYDWTATWGDHLIRAWADSADRYVELREDNNQGYIFKHIQPKVSVVIDLPPKYVPPSLLLFSCCYGYLGT